jgi:hypothetical protein
MSLKEGEEVQVKGIHNILKKIAKNYANVKKYLSIQVLEDSRTTNNIEQNRTSQWYIILKTTSTENREKIIEGCKRGEANNIFYSFSTERIKEGIEREILSTERKFQP